MKKILMVALSLILMGLMICNPCAATVYAECGDVNGKAEYLCQTAECIEEKILAFLEERNHETKP